MTSDFANISLPQPTKNIACAAFKLKLRFAQITKQLSPYTLIISHTLLSRTKTSHEIIK